jgi:thiamine monophosphate kinase
MYHHGVRLKPNCLYWNSVVAASFDSSDGLLNSFHLQQLCNSAANVA